MSRQKMFNVLLLVAMVVSLLVGGGGQVLADKGGPKLPHQKQGPITPADRKAAAENAQKKGLVVSTPGAVKAAAVAAAPSQGGVPDYFGPYANWAWSPLAQIDPTTGLGTAGTGVLKFDPQNTLADTPATPGGLTLAAGTPCNFSNQAARCYEIHLQQFQVQILPPPLPKTTIRGYVEYLNGSPQGQTYLGPVIVAQRNVPVRITFVNDLQTSDGDLFLPVDTTYMGAGDGPSAMATSNCSVTPKPAECYSDNRATLHLHGGTTPWISDGTPHQWTTPVSEQALPAGPGKSMYPEGVSVSNVPDQWYDPTSHLPVSPGTPGATNDPGPGRITFYYSNEQSARLMFYHDHAYGITRLNVYAGEAAGYLVTDSTEQTLINGGNISYTDPAGATVSVPVAAGTLPGIGTPLVIQDKSFVDATTVLTTDPTWNWGTGALANGVRPPVSGDLWFPHVYMPNQNPWDITGANPMGRWDYGPWFWPPMTLLQHGSISNPYCLPTPPAATATETNPGFYDCSAAPWEPPFIPGTPPNPTVAAAANSPSGTPEAFMDTPIVNGKAYPVLHVAPGLTRFRILNAANDRFLNLQLYQASSATSGIVGSITLSSGGSGYTTAPAVTISNAAGDTTGTGATATATIDPVTGAVTSVDLYTVGSGYTSAPMISFTPPPAGGTAPVALAHLYTAPTEVGMVPFNSNQNAISNFPSWWYTAGLPFSLDDRVGGVPDPRLRGPAWIQIGTEGGFLPNPALILNQPINFDYNRKSITVLNILQHALFLGPAERADVLVDFTNFQGKTLILYNDSTAPTPANESRVDYYTGDPDQTMMGGAPSTPPGFGPNTRTIMQIVVDQPAPAGVTPTSTAPVDDYNPTTLSTLQTVIPAAFGASQETIIVPQAAYAKAYNNAGVFPTNASQYVTIQATQYGFDPIGPAGAVTAALQPKAIQELFTLDFGRMNATLGVEIPNTNGINQTTIPYGFIDPPTELLKASDSQYISTTPLATLADGTQIWKITHNGVDTHVIHVHMFTMQLVNRVGWDGAIKPGDPNEIGWKDTLRMNPLEDVIVAVRPIQLKNLPFDLPNSWRLLDPTMPVDSVVGFTNVNPLGNPVTTVNRKVNFGYEYVWHCHILGHEENDMMRAMAVAIPPKAPTGLTVATAKGGVSLTWTDNSVNETGWLIEKNPGTGVWSTLVNLQSTSEATVGAKVSYIDKAFTTGTSYRVSGVNVVGTTAQTYPNPILTGYSTITASSTAPALVSPPAGVTTITSVTQAAALKSPVVVAWSYSLADQTGFTVQRATNSTFTAGVTNFAVAGTATSYNDTTTKAGVTYWYRVRPTNLLGAGAWSTNSPSIVPHA